ncbi:MAG: RecX family transcriptional regulator [bacterium]|nr:RecX family transcriptional regulator [bacterium]
MITYLSSYGISKIKNDLIKQNISENIIDEQLNDLDKNIFSERLEKIVKKKIESNKKYSNNFLRQKLINDLINLGYDRSDIINIIDKHIKNDTSILECEYNKLYNRLKLKYDGIEFKNKLIQKLIQKGFNREDIYNLIQKKED